MFVHCFFLLVIDWISTSHTWGIFSGELDQSYENLFKINVIYANSSIKKIDIGLKKIYTYFKH